MASQIVIPKSLSTGYTPFAFIVLLNSIEIFMRNINDIIDSEVRKSIPSNWRMIDCKKLLWKEPYKIKYAFHSSIIDGNKYENLSNVIRDIWSGKLRFSGPQIGIQQINLEIMIDKCWKCKNIMKTVSGIVFPNKQLDKWDNEDWLYYNQLVTLSSLNSTQVQDIKNFVCILRMYDDSITLVDFRFSKTAKSKYCGAVCPHTCFTGWKRI